MKPPSLRLEMLQQPPTFIWRAHGFAMRRWYVLLVFGVLATVLGYFLYGLTGALIGATVGFSPLLFFMGIRFGVIRP